MKDPKQFLKKLAQLKQEHRLDLSLDEDLSLAIMNLISLEEHLFFTGAKTDREGYYDLLSQVREIRKNLLKKIVKEAEGEVWCISKHLLAASMRLVEVGNKCFSQGKKAEARELFTKAYDLYSMFWGINLNWIDLGEIKKAGLQKLKGHNKEDGHLMEELNALVQKLIDCCDE